MCARPHACSPIQNAMHPAQNDSPPDPRDSKPPETRPIRRRQRRTAHHTLLFGFTKNKRAIWAIAIAITAAIAIAAIALVATDLSWASLARAWQWLIRAIERLNPVAVLPLMALLPIAGFPIGMVYLVAGARFGPVVGGLVVACVTAVHMLGTYVVGRSFLRAPLQRFIERRHQHLPEVPADEHAAVAVIATLIPGLPYFVRNYLLVLAGVRLSVFFTVCLPIYVARSYVTILLGNLSSDPTRTALIVLLIFDVLKVAICALVIWRLRVHHRKFHGPHGEDHDHPGEDAPGDAPVQPSGAGS